MPILTADDLAKAFGTRTLFEHASFSAEEGEKVGFIGPNGSGKSTLFLILAGLETPDRGALALRRGASVGYLAQEPEFPPDQTIRTAVAAGRPEMVGALQAYSEVSEQLESGTAAAIETEKLLARQQQAIARIEALGGWSWQHEVESILTQLGLDRWDRSVEGLSGGERKRVALGRVLLEKPDLLLLDEPTNHLDADTTLWLEEHLLDYSGAVLLITHDRYFLDRVVDRMIEVGADGFTSYEGGYTEYLEARAARAELVRTEAAKRDRLLEQELAWVKRSPAARTGKQKARIKRAEALRADASATRGGDEPVEIHFGPPPRLGRTVLELENVAKRYGERILIRGLSTRFKAGERIGVIGPNGAGKTTLLRLLTGEVEPDSGSIRFGQNTKTAYFDQARTDLDPDLSVYDSISNEDWVEFGGRRVHVRSYLESFLFPTSTHEQRVGSLSGGERNRLLLARLLLDEANLLLLDEPTNDLDLDTLRALESALTDFAGCALVVTHDRFFLDKVATGLLVFEGDGIVHRHEGGYDLYRRLREQERAAAEVEEKARKKATRATPVPRQKDGATSRRLTYNEKRELAGIEEAILEAESARDSLGIRLSDPALYAETPEKVAPLHEQFAAAERRVAELYARWEELDQISSGG